MRRSNKMASWERGKVRNMGCKRRFVPNPAVKNQRYCGSVNCQKARKRAWQKERLAHDPDYRANEAQAQSQWMSRNKDYWKEYRKRHPTYQEKNRLRQRERNRRRSQIAKDGRASHKNSHLFRRLLPRSLCGNQIAHSTHFEHSIRFYPNGLPALRPRPPLI